LDRAKYHPIHSTPDCGTFLKERFFWRSGMALQSLSDEALVERIRAYAQTHAIPLHGPAEIEYGFGWAPTITFWAADRRMHLYGDIRHYAHGLTVELAEAGPSTIVRCIEVNEPQTLYTLIDRFFGQQTPLQAMSDVPWRSAGLDHDKFIPHPPGAPNPANIVDSLRQAEPWQPGRADAVPSIQLLEWLRKRLRKA
jgi:hypothetical protein